MSSITQINVIDNSRDCFRENLVIIGCRHQQLTSCETGSRQEPPSRIYPSYLLGNVYENVIAALNRCYKSVSLVPAEALHDALDKRISHGSIRTEKNSENINHLEISCRGVYSGLMEIKDATARFAYHKRCSKVLTRIFWLETAE